MNSKPLQDQGQQLPKIKKSDLDVDALGEEMAQRKEELLAEMEEAQ